MAATWKCRGCGTVNPRRKKNCAGDNCKRTRPAKRVAAHKKILEHPYEWWVERYGGEACGICGRPPSPGRRFDRDHDHKTGEARGLLCHRCNRSLVSWMDAEWLQKAIEYLGGNNRVRPA